MFRRIRIINTLLHSLLRDEKGQMLALELQLEVSKAWNEHSRRAKNPLTANPRSYFSQSDEDGILEKILVRIGKSDSGKVIEFGVGRGNENNSLALLAKGWRGYWVGGEELCFEIPKTDRLGFSKSWITLENILDFSVTAKEFLGEGEIDLVSLDLDGNDYHFTEKLLTSGLRPKVWVSEYNAKFPVGAEWVMPYDENHAWTGDDYYGASFTSFTKLFRTHGYFPVACSISGANVFFVSNEFRNQFLDLEMTEDEIYEPPAYHLVRRWGHRKSPKTLESIFVDR